MTEKKYFSDEEWAGLKAMVDNAESRKVFETAIDFIIDKAEARGMTEEEITKLLSPWYKPKTTVEVFVIGMPPVPLGPPSPIEPLESPIPMSIKNIAIQMERCKLCPTVEGCKDYKNMTDELIGHFRGMIDKLNPLLGALFGRP